MPKRKQINENSLHSTMWMEYAVCVQQIRNFCNEEKYGENQEKVSKVSQTEHGLDELGKNVSSNFSADSNSERGHSNGTIEDIPSVPVSVLEQWWKCFGLVRKVEKEVDIRSILAFVAPIASLPLPTDSPSLRKPLPVKEAVSQRSFHARKKDDGSVVGAPLKLHHGVNTLLQCALKRQEMLYSTHTLSFAELHERYTRWTVILFFWIQRRVIQCVTKEQNIWDAGMHPDEVRRYRFFLSTAGELLGESVNKEREKISSVGALQSLLFNLSDAQFLGDVPNKMMISAEEQQLRMALQKCVDGAQRDTMEVPWDVLHPSSLPYAVLSRLRKNAAVWIKNADYEKVLSHISVTNCTSCLGTRNSRLEDSLSLDWNAGVTRNLLSASLNSAVDEPSQTTFTFLCPLQYAWETNISVIQRWNLSSNFIDYFHWTLKYLVFIMSNKISLQKVGYIYSIIPVFVALSCAIELCKELHLISEESEAKECLSFSFSRFSPNFLFSCLHDAVALGIERMIGDILHPYTLKSKDKDRVVIFSKTKLSVHSALFRLLVEAIEPSACLLQGYIEKLEPSVAVSCPYWFRAVTQSTKLFWNMLGSAALRGFAAVLFSPVSNGSVSELHKKDYCLLFYYLHERFYCDVTKV